MFNLSLKSDKTTSANSLKITRAELERLNQLKELDLQVCSFCHKITILNLGWESFGKFYCRLHEAEYILCWELCYKVCLNIWGCELYQEVKEVSRTVIKSNCQYNWASCYLCGKELKGAGKTGIVKNRNNPRFWGVSSSYKILCLSCLGKRYLNELSKSKRRTYFKYVKRGYV